MRARARIEFRARPSLQPAPQVVQEGGRAGRVRPGRHLSLFRTSELPRRSVPEIRLEKPHRLVLKLVRRGQWETRSELRWLPGEAPDDAAMRDALRDLEDAGCLLDTQVPEVAEIGTAALGLPLDLFHGLFVLEAQARGFGIEAACIPSSQYWLFFFILDLQDLMLPRFSGPSRASQRLSWQRERGGSLGDPPGP